MASAFGGQRSIQLSYGCLLAALSSVWAARQAGNRLWGSPRLILHGRFGRICFCRAGFRGNRLSVIRLNRQIISQMNRIAHEDPRRRRL